MAPYIEKSRALPKGPVLIPNQSTEAAYNFEEEKKTTSTDLAEHSLYDPDTSISISKKKGKFKRFFNYINKKVCATGAQARNTDTMRGGTETRIASQPRKSSKMLEPSADRSDSMRKRDADKIRMQKMRKNEEYEIRKSTDMRSSKSASVLSRNWLRKIKLAFHQNQI